MVRAFQFLTMMFIAVYFQNCSKADFGVQSVNANAGAPIDNELIVEYPDGTPTFPPECFGDRDDDDEDGDCCDHGECDGTTALSSLFKSSSATFSSSSRRSRPTPRPSPIPAACDCPQVTADRILINVNRIELLPAGITVAVPADTVVDLLTLDTEGFIFGPLPSGGDVQQIRLVLNDFGNKIITPTPSEIPLRTPSAGNTGIVLDLAAAVPLEAGKSYLIQANDPSTAIVRSGVMCVLRPDIQITNIQEAAPAE
ncbi:MAG TPA: DUF4382 domain-containing protein [Bdellovibrionales bacterium]|nr:DUF4382 domain-containing protein [Bdellovibrionales bacterium]